MARGTHITPWELMLKPVSAHFLGLEEETACAGLAGAVLLPVTGLGVGLAQAVRGAINTPEAIRESGRGRHWDQVLCPCTSNSAAFSATADLACACRVCLP